MPEYTHKPNRFRQIMADLFYIVLFLVCFWTILVFGGDDRDMKPGNYRLEQQTAQSSGSDKSEGP